MGSRSIAFVWDNLGPSHHDRLRAVHRAGLDPVAIELFERSHVYNWEDCETPPYPVVTLSERIGSIGTPALAGHIVRAIRKSGARDVFMCHYEMPAIFIAAWLLKLSGHRVYTMLNSKFDDYPRHWRVTPLKALAFTPYSGAMIASERSRDYVSYLGIRRDRTAGGYNTLDLTRLREQSGDPGPVPFEGRPFLAVAQLIPRKNLMTAMEAFAAYRRDHGGERRLVIVGEGAQEQELRSRAAELGIAEAVDFAGAMPSAGVTGLMRRSLALLLPSWEETYGFVVVEAMAMGLPPIVSLRAGAADMVANLVDGFLIDPKDEKQLLAAMLTLDGDEALHARMSRAALEASERADVREFVRGVAALSA